MDLKALLAKKKLEGQKNLEVLEAKSAPVQKTSMLSNGYYPVRYLSYFSSPDSDIARMEGEGYSLPTSGIVLEDARSASTNNVIVGIDVAIPGKDKTITIPHNLSPQEKLRALFKKSEPEQKKIIQTELQKKLEGITLNEQQLRGVSIALNPAIREWCLIGAAGTGKTTTVKAIAKGLVEGPLKGLRLTMHHKHLPYGILPIAFVSFTNRAVRNIRRVLPKELQSNCITIHALLEYYFERIEKIDRESGMIRISMQSVPKRGAEYKLDSLKYLIVDEASMCAVNLWDELKAALPDDCRVLFLGDLNQLPPIYNSAILGFKLADAARDPIHHPCVELTQVYRQALDNPILFDAHRILANDLAYFSEIKLKRGDLNRPPHLIYKPFKKQVEAETACVILAGGFQKMMDIGEYNCDEDCILIPYNKQFGTIEFNKFIAQRRQEKANVPVHEIISLYVKHYFAVGDRILIGKYEGKINEIIRNPKYVGKIPRSESVLLTRWGHLRSSDATETNFALEQTPFNADEGDLQNMSMEDIDAMLNKIGKGDDAKRQASHIITVELAETGELINLSEAGEINSILFAYALTVHKAQGAEWRKVFFILHSSHGTMASRELIYTAMTRAREELVVICDARLFSEAVGRQKIKGNNLAEKAEFFKGKAEERQNKQLNLLVAE